MRSDDAEADRGRYRESDDDSCERLTTHADVSVETSGIFEHVVRPEPPPRDMLATVSDLLALRKGRPPVRDERQLQMQPRRLHHAGRWTSP